MELDRVESFEFFIAGDTVTAFLIVDGQDVFSAFKGLDQWHPYDDKDLADLAAMYVQLSVRAALIKADLSSGGAS